MNAPEKSTPLLSVQGLSKHFALKGSLLASLTRKPNNKVRAVDGVDFEVYEGETLGVVGESGCGKSTTARLLMHLIAPTGGSVRFEGQKVGSDLSLKAFHSQVQMVFQDSYASLNPRLTIADSVAFGPQVHGVPREASLARAHDLLQRVGLEPARFAGRYPHELSGGQRQRVNIARALALQPRLIILDEAVSALDKSVEAQVLNLLLDLKQEFGLTYIFISHDLNVVRFMSDRVMVMYLGQVAEVGPSEDLFKAAGHPYTQALLKSLPATDPDHRTQEAPLLGDPPNPIDPPSGCRFHPRCSKASEVCATSIPSSIALSTQHRVSCLIHQKGSGHPLANEQPIANDHQYAGASAVSQVAT